MGAKKNHLIETVLLSTHNKTFGLEIRKLFLPKYDKTAIIIISGKLIKKVNFRPYIR